MSRPTEEAYGEFQKAYDFYNQALFASTLPPCLITLHRESKRTYGYFSHKRFFRLTDGRSTTDEIAMNPVHFSGRSVEDILSTLAHEMTHVWQAHFGKPGRRGYHNKQWAAKMKEVGLGPSNTGEPGGKETGQQMTHYIVEGGPFKTATDALIKGGFSISWADAAAIADDPAVPKPKSGQRVKYTCPGCDANVWGKDGLAILCQPCQQPFLAPEADDDV
jgi:hypothetical protein